MQFKFGTYAAAILMALLVAAFAASTRAAETTKLAPPGAKFDLERALEGRGQDADKLWKEVKSAWLLFGPFTGTDPKAAELHLQKYMLDTTPKVLNLHQEKLRNLDWHPGFSEVFDRARAWRKNLNTMTMDQVFEVRNSLHRLAKITAETRFSEQYTYLALSLKHLLMNLKHMPTLFEFAVTKIGRDNEIDRNDGYAWIQFLANEGDYAPAQIYGAQIYLKNSRGRSKTVQRKARMEAYYLLRRAERSDPTVTAKRQEVEKRLTLAQIREVDSWLRKYPPIHPR